MINLANAPLANIWFPDDEARSRVVAAYTTVAAGGGTAVVTATIPNNYPPIDRTIPCPVLAIVAADNTAGGLLALGQEMFAMSIGGVVGQMGALAPDSVGEFQITGARTIDFYQTDNTTQAVLIIYVAKGSGQET